MNKYMIVKVEDAERNSLMPGVDNPAHTNLSKIRQAVHGAAEMSKISITDMVVDHTGFMYGLMTDLEARQVIMIFETALKRGRERAKTG